MNKKLQRSLKGHKSLLFMDFEGTQYSHEMIAIGAILVHIDPKSGRIKKKKDPFKIYVKAHNKIGAFVTNLTGISEQKLKDEGVSFDVAMKSLKKYCGLYFKKLTFITFGNHDMRILNQSIMYNIKYPGEITSQIQKNYFDFAAFLNEFVRDDKENALSLVHACELFHVKEAGDAHDPEVDAINLANLYDAFLVNTNLVADQYKRHLQRSSGTLPDPVTVVINKLSSGQTVTAHDYEEFIRKSLS